MFYIDAAGRSEPLPPHYDSFETRRAVQNVANNRGVSATLRSDRGGVIYTLSPETPTLVYSIKLRPKDGKFSLRDAKDTLIGVFDTHAEAEREATERFPDKTPTWRRHATEVAARRGSFGSTPIEEDPRAFRVHVGGKRYKYFPSLAAAQPFLNEVHRKTRTVLSIERTPKRGSGKRESTRMFQPGAFAMERADSNRESMARAAATDAGNRSMRKARRKVWNEDDYNASVREYNRLMPMQPGEQDARD